MTQTHSSLVQRQSAAKDVFMDCVKVPISVLAILDGRALIVTLALIYLAVHMAAVTDMDWHVNVKMDGVVDCVIFLCVTTVLTENVLPLVCVNATQAGRDPTVTNVCHWLDAMFQLEVTVWIAKTITFQTLAFAMKTILDTFAMSPCVILHALKDMANVYLVSTTQPPLFASAMLDGRGMTAATALYILAAQ